MVLRWEAVNDWVSALRSVDAAALPTGLSPEGARAAWDAAIGALDALPAVAAIGGAPWPTVTVVAARTVFTAPIEWCAVLLGRGSRVVLKHPAGLPGAAPALAEAARAVGLPLVATDAREAVDDADLVVVMGTDETVAAVRARTPAPVLAHGHRFSAAYVVDDWDGVAAAAAMHDGRGCLSPVVVFTPTALPAACDALAGAMARAEARWPRGEVGAVEHATIRARGALARVVGVERSGPGWAVHGLPVGELEPVALPRALVVVQADLDGAIAALGPWTRWLSTIGTDVPTSVPRWLAQGATRVCAPGEMQRPPLVRLHDGQDWLRQTARPT